MDRTSRREFLARVGGGAIAASLGSRLASELRLLPRAWAESGSDLPTFGALEPLVDLMIETPADRLVPALVEKIKTGTKLRDLVAAGALANARTFGGEDYVGFHTIMALSPAYRIALELPEPEQPLPVLKVLHRNTHRIQESGSAKNPVLRSVPDSAGEGQATAEALREAVRRKDAEAAERIFARLARGRPNEALDNLLPTVEDATEVHRVVLPYRAYDLLDLVGEENAHLLLRQSVRYCARNEQNAYMQRFSRSRELLAELLDGLELGSSSAPGRKPLDDAQVEALSRRIFEAREPAEAARAAARALSEGVAPDQVGEAISLAANQLVLRDHGRHDNEIQAQKPKGSVHGDSIGVHGCDSANAWRNLARLANARNAAACLILGAFQVAFDRTNRGGDFLAWEPHPLAEALASVKTKDPGELVRDLEGAIREQDQARAAAIVHRSCELGHAHEPIVAVMRKFAVTEDGALHAEKFFRTTTQEIAANRPAFRSRHLVALARVTASEFGQPAPGVSEAKQLLGV